jgi:hypothetical protein
MKLFQLAEELRRTDVAGSADLPIIPEVSYDKYGADYECDDSLDLGGVKAKAPISLKHMEFPLKQFAKRMDQPKFSTFKK